MFFRANPGMTSLPCSCKEIYARNAAEELLQEDECYDLYGRCRYSNILYRNKEDLAMKATADDGEVSSIFSQLKLHPSPSKTNIYDLLEISPWRACAIVRHPHKACLVISENLSSSEKQKSGEPTIQRRSLSTCEATANAKKKGKSENGYEAIRPYSDSKLNENSRKPNEISRNSKEISRKANENSQNSKEISRPTNIPGWNSSRLCSKNTFENTYKFHHFKDFWEYMKEYMDCVTIIRLQEQYRVQISRRRGSVRTQYERQRWCCQDTTSKECDKVNDQVKEVPATNHELARGDSRKNSLVPRDKPCDDTCFSFKFPSFETCSFKVARCCVHTESRKENKPRRYKDRDKEREHESSVINEKIQMLCQRLANVNNCIKDRRVRRQESTKILQKSRTRKLEIVTRPSNKTPRKNPSITKLKGQPLQWQEYGNLAKRFPSPRIICKSPLVAKQANFQGKIVAKKYPTKIPKDYNPLEISKTQKLFLKYGPM